MAGRRAARRIDEERRIRTLDGTDPPRTPANAPAEPAPTPPPVAPPAPAPSRPPIDLEASRRALEERQVTWIKFREEWIRRRADGRAAGFRKRRPASSASPPDEGTSPSP